MHPEIYNYPQIRQRWHVAILTAMSSERASWIAWDGAKLALDPLRTPSCHSMDPFHTAIPGSLLHSHSAHRIDFSKPTGSAQVVQKPLQ